MFTKKTCLSLILCSCIVAAVSGQEKATEKKNAEEKPKSTFLELYNAPRTGITASDVDGDGMVDLFFGNEMRFVTGDANQDGTLDLYFGTNADDYLYVLGMTPEQQKLQTMGLQLRPVQDDILRGHLNLAPQQGLIVDRVRQASPASKAGLKRGDVLLSVNGNAVANQGVLVQQLEQQKMNGISVELVRAGNRLQQELTLDLTIEQPKTYRIGVSVEEAGETLSSQLQLEEGQGLIITAVVDDMPAKKSDLRKHDVLLRVGDTTLTTLEDLRGAIGRSEGKDVTVTFLRHGKRQAVVVVPQEHSARSETLMAVDVLENTLLPQGTFELMVTPAVVDNFNVEEKAAITDLDQILNQIDELRKTVEAMKEEK